MITKKMPTYMLIALLAQPFYSFANEKSVIDSFKKNVISKLDGATIKINPINVTKGSLVYKTSIRIESYDVLKTKSLITPYEGVVYLSGILETCIKKSEKSEKKCTKETSTNKERILKFSMETNDKWLPISISSGEKFKRLNKEILKKENTNKNNNFLSIINSFYD